MPSLTEFAALTRTTSVEVDGIAVELTYRPHVLTTAFLLGMYERSMEELIGEVVTGWNLTGEDGAVIPLTAEGLGPVPAPLLHGLWRGIERAAVRGN